MPKDYMSNDYTSKEKNKEKLHPTFSVRVDSDYGPGDGDWKKREAKRYKVELMELNKLLKLSDESLAKLARKQLTAQKEVSEAKLQLWKAENIKVGDVFSDMKEKEEEE